MKYASTRGERRDRRFSDAWERRRTTIDPHTADGVKVAREHLRPGIRTVVLETALPLKFEDTIRKATGQTAP